MYSSLTLRPSARGSALRPASGAYEAGLGREISAALLVASRIALAAMRRVNNRFLRQNDGTTHRFDV
jgi:hypothetical protein